MIADIQIFCFIISLLSLVYCSWNHVAWVIAIIVPILVISFYLIVKTDSSNNYWDDER